MAKLNPFQQQLERFQKQFGYGTAAYNEAVTNYTKQQFGSIDKSTIPSGSKIVYESPGGDRLVYEDPEGYQTVLQRQLDARLENFGKVSKESTNRPAVVTPSNQKNLLDNLIQQYSGSQLAELDDNALAALDKMTKSIQSQLNQKFQEDQGNLISSLYGRGLNQSTLANDAAGRLLQQQGLVNEQTLADAAGRELGLRQNITTNNLDLLKNLAGLQQAAQVESGQQGLQQQQINNAYEQFLKELNLKRDQYEAATNKSPLGSILGGLASTALGVASGGTSSPFTSALKGLFGGSSGGNTFGLGTEGLLKTPSTFPSYF